MTFNQLLTSVVVYGWVIFCIGTIVLVYKKFKD